MVFPFIVGCGRSGTTLLWAMVDSHPEMAVTYESHFIPPTARRAPRYATLDGFSTDRFAADLVADRNFRTFGLTPAEVRAALASGVDSYPDAVRRVFALYAARMGKVRYGDKTPYYVLWLPLLAGLFPEARFVHVIRDGRDTASCLTEMPFGPDGIGEAAYYWKERVTAGRAAGRRLGPARYREVRYEDLVDDPERELRSVCGFFELDYHPALLRYYDDGDRVVAGTGVPEQHHHLRLPPTRGLTDWRRDLAPADVALVEAVAGDLLTELGYERATGGMDGGAGGTVGRTDVLRAWGRWRVWRTRRRRALRATARPVIGPGSGRPRRQRGS